MAAASLRASSSRLIGSLRRVSGRGHTPLLAFLAPRPTNCQPYSILSCTKEEGIQAKRNWKPVFASNANSSEGSQDREASDAPQGPPLLTILAGAVVFFLFCWIIGSIVMWVVGLIFHPPQLR